VEGRTLRVHYEYPTLPAAGQPYLSSTGQGILRTALPATAILGVSNGIMNRLAREGVLKGFEPFNFADVPGESQLVL